MRYSDEHRVNSLKKNYFTRFVPVTQQYSLWRPLVNVTILQVLAAHRSRRVFTACTLVVLTVQDAVKLPAKVMGNGEFLPLVLRNPLINFHETTANAIRPLHETPVH